MEARVWVSLSSGKLLSHHGFVHIVRCVAYTFIQRIYEFPSHSPFPFLALGCCVGSEVVMGHFFSWEGLVAAEGFRPLDSFNDHSFYMHFC